MLQDFSSEHILEQRLGFANSWGPFKSENAPVEWLRVLVDRSGQDAGFLRAAGSVGTFATPAGLYRNMEPRKRRAHES